MGHQGIAGKKTPVAPWRLFAFTLLTTLFSSSPIIANTADAEQQTLKVANSKAWKPFSYINNDGEPDGILIDLWREYGQRNQIKIEFVLMDWNESLQAVKSNQADVHAGLLWSEPRDQFLDFGDALINIETQLYYSQSLVGSGIDELLDGKVERYVGVVKGGYEEYYTRKEFPNANLKVYSNNQRLINAAFKGEISAFVADLQVANFYLYSSGDPMSFVPVKYLYSGDLYPAVAEGNLAMLDKVNLGFKKVGKPTRETILHKWMHIETVYPQYFFATVAGVSGFVVLMYIIMLKRTVRSRTRALELANEQLTVLSTTDELTGIRNRRSFMEAIRQLDTKSHSLTVMVFDIDNFKSVNDNWGHAIGDEVIREVAQCIAPILTPTMLFGRIGGEEFALVVRELSQEAALELAQNICVKVSATKIQIECDRHISVSVGCAFYPHGSEKVDLAAADKLMYKAKQQGKNRAVIELIDS
ncbi:transporter substrate-binding domain-containing diguanylate cyclase [Vibrio sp. T11.5]|uniref:transporter substrate-binding domain-containing diguanylate cyclase n=1 Tax=Vibrio sp. T11.5 TaxID=2998836 RepID=UPI0022CDB9A9|nr:sensor domain-containing diguanylate cyclase [Vibrio sp. T11.5]MDA0118913.1 sensor domain-containing diguanylate cyclase [Vibrio sp. T11.5]